MMWYAAWSLIWKKSCCLGRKGNNGGASVCLYRMQSPEARDRNSRFAVREESRVDSILMPLHMRDLKPGISSNIPLRQVSTQ